VSVTPVTGGVTDTIMWRASFFENLSVARWRLRNKQRSRRGRRSIGEDQHPTGISEL